MKHLPNLRALLRHVTNATDFASWLHTDGEQLVNAADNLGGPKWAKRAQAVVEAVQTGQDLTAWRRELRALRQLLRLDLVNNLASEEARRFASIHPDDPRADEARRCVEALDRGIRAIEALKLAGLARIGGAL